MSHTQYTLDGQPLKQVAYISDLGITVSSDLSWSKHIEITAAKANKTLGLIKRICRDIHDPPPDDSYTAPWLGRNWNMRVMFGGPTP